MKLKLRTRLRIATIFKGLKMELTLPLFYEDPLLYSGENQEFVSILQTLTRNIPSKNQDRQRQLSSMYFRALFYQRSFQNIVIFWVTSPKIQKQLATTFVFGTVLTSKFLFHSSSIFSWTFVERISYPNCNIGNNK